MPNLLLSKFLIVPIFLLCSAALRARAIPLRDISHPADVYSRSSNEHWVDIWTAMPQLTESSNLPPKPFNQSDVVFANATIRQTLHMALGASQIRLRISNAFGVKSLPITAVTVALPYNGSAGARAIQSDTVKEVTFSGNSSITIPNGALAISDPLNFTVDAESMLTVSMYLKQGQTGGAITSHPGSRTTSWFSFGNHVSTKNLTDSSTLSAAHWYFLSAVEAWLPSSSRAFGIVGDSITDGRGSDTNGNNRWPDLLLARMQDNSSTSNIAVVNQAAGGNRILADGLGPNALGRIDRDILSQSSIKYMMVFEGVNDIGSASATESAQSLVGDRLIWALDQIISRAHAVELPIFGATITPFGAPNTTIQPYSSTVREKTRQRVNTWIRESGRFDAVVDIDKMLRDPDTPSQLNAKYNSGDYLHPNVAGYQYIANNFPLTVFEEYSDGVSVFT